MGRLRRALFFFFGVFFLGASTRALAWDVFQDDGKLIKWDESELTLGLTPPKSELSQAEVEAVFQRSIDAWALAPCGSPELRLISREEGLSLDPNDGLHTVVFIDDKDHWDARFLSSELARTLVSYDLRTGKMVDVDMAINQAYFDFSLEDDCSEAVVYDLESVTTHELGHFLGLNHSVVTGATMQPNMNAGECEKRYPSDDDFLGLCYLYPEKDELEEEAPEEPEGEAEVEGEGGLQDVFSGDREEPDGGQDSPSDAPPNGDVGEEGTKTEAHGCGLFGASQGALLFPFLGLFFLFLRQRRET